MKHEKELYKGHSPLLGMQHRPKLNPHSSSYFSFAVHSSLQVPPLIAHTSCSVLFAVEIYRYLTYFKLGFAGSCQKCIYSNNQVSYRGKTYWHSKCSHCFLGTRMAVARWLGKTSHPHRDLDKFQRQGSEQGGKCSKCSSQNILLVRSFPRQHRNYDIVHSNSHTVPTCTLELYKIDLMPYMGRICREYDKTYHNYRVRQ